MKRFFGLVFATVGGWVGWKIGIWPKTAPQQLTRLQLPFRRGAARPANLVDQLYKLPELGLALLSGLLGLPHALYSL